MILKSRREIALMRDAGKVVAECLELCREMSKPGVTTIEIDRKVEALIRQRGATPAFKGYSLYGKPPYPASICASINEEVVHGIPDARVLKEGDILSIDVGTCLKHYYGDAAATFPVGAISKEAAKLLEVTKTALFKAIEKMRSGVKLRELSRTIQQNAESQGFSVVRDFVGHGIGTKMHEDPQVPNFVSAGFPGFHTTVLKPGAVLALEPMLNVGGSAVEELGNKWTVVTKDRMLSAHFEHSVAVTDDEPEILTAL